MKKEGLVALWAILVTMAACALDSEWTALGGSSENCILAVFRQEATRPEIEEFLGKHTRGPVRPSGGYDHLPGIGAVIRRDIDGLVGYEICFKEKARLELRKSIAERMKHSPIPLRILEGEEAKTAVSNQRISY